MKHSLCSSIVHDGQTATHIAIAISREISKSASTFFSETHQKIPGWQSIILAALHPPRRETPTRLQDDVR
jgi:hypothetical protein